MLIQKPQFKACCVQGVEKKYRVLLPVIFVAEVFSGNRFYCYKSCICKFYVATFRQD